MSQSQTKSNLISVHNNNKNKFTDFCSLFLIIFLSNIRVQMFPMNSSFLQMMQNNMVSGFVLLQTECIVSFPDRIYTNLIDTQCSICRKPESRFLHNNSIEIISIHHTCIRLSTGLTVDYHLWHSIWNT